MFLFSFITSTTLRICAFLFVLSYTLSQKCDAQLAYFEGVVEYKFMEYNTDFKSKNVFKVNKNPFIEEQIGYFQNGNYLFRVTKGQILSILFGNRVPDVVVRGKEAQYFRLDHVDSIAYMIDAVKLDSSEIPQAISTGREKTILGYLCAEYMIETVDYPSHQKVINYIWVTKDVAIEGVSLINKLLAYRSNLLTGYSNLNGLILEATLQANKGRIVITATKVTPQKLEETMFLIPKAYQQKKEGSR